MSERVAYLEIVGAYIVQQRVEELNYKKAWCYVRIGKIVLRKRN